MNEDRGWWVAPLIGFAIVAGCSAIVYGVEYLLAWWFDRYRDEDGGTTYDKP